MKYSKVFPKENYFQAWRMGIYDVPQGIYKDPY